MAFIDKSAEDMTGNRESDRKGTRAGSRTRVRCRASAHGAHALPTELNGPPSHTIFSYCHTCCCICFELCLNCSY